MSIDQQQNFKIYKAKTNGTERRKPQIRKYSQRFQHLSLNKMEVSNVVKDFNKATKFPT